VVPVGIYREELGNFVGGEALGLCRFYGIIVVVLANLLLIQVILIGC